MSNRRFEPNFAFEGVQNIPEQWQTSGRSDNAYPPGLHVRILTLLHGKRAL
jgi:hypothetical protein